MQRFLIEREIDGASELTEAQLASSCRDVQPGGRSLGVPYTWVTTYVAGDKLYCLHETDDSESVLEHARRGDSRGPGVGRGQRVRPADGGKGPGRLTDRALGIGVVGVTPATPFARRNPRLPRRDEPVYSHPVLLLEREDELAILRGRLAAASAGQGGAIAVCGEPGAGKSALVEAAYAQAPDLRVLRGGCDPLTTPRPLGPFRDIGRAAGIAALLTGDDLSRAHVCEVVYDAMTTEPTVLVIEDLHWADAASVEVLRFLIRRVGCPAALSMVDHLSGRGSVRSIRRGRSLGTSPPSTGAHDSFGCHPSRCDGMRPACSPGHRWTPRGCTR